MNSYSAESNCSRRAEAVLRALTGGDDQMLRQELNRSVWASPGLPGCEQEDERTEVLRAVVLRMLKLGTSTASENPEVQVCIDLLTHLASPPLVRAATAR